MSGIRIVAFTADDMSPARQESFWLRIAHGRADACWPWMGKSAPTGYGRVKLKGSEVAAHRVAYTLARGTIPDGLVIDHLCRNRACCNPDHLEAVTNRENLTRGLQSYAIRDTCKAGLHDITAAAAIEVTSAGTRTCHECRRESGARYRQAKRQAFFDEHGYWPHQSRARDTCAKGHDTRPGSPNLYVSPTGQRNCRACAQINDRARRARATA